MTRPTVIAALLVGATTLAAAVGLAASPDEPPAASTIPKRVVSVNLCADQLIVELADRNQIAGMTSNARDRDMSAVAERVAGLPLLRNSAEQLVVIQPDLVIGMPAKGIAATGPLRDGQRRLLDLQIPTDYAQIVGSIRTVADALGHPERGEGVIDRMNTDLARIGAPGRGRMGAYYQRRGYLTGSDTLVDDLMKRVGLVNLATRLGKPPLAQVSLEEIIAARPDFLIIESDADQVVDQGTEMLRHPALRDVPRIVIPQAWTVCGDPSYVEAAKSMAAQIAKHP